MDAVFSRMYESDAKGGRTERRRLRGWLDRADYEKAIALLVSAAELVASRRT